MWNDLNDLKIIINRWIQLFFAVIFSVLYSFLTPIATLISFHSFYSYLSICWVFQAWPKVYILPSLYETDILIRWFSLLIFILTVLHSCWLVLFQHCLLCSVETVWVLLGGGNEHAPSIMQNVSVVIAWQLWVQRPHPVWERGGMNKRED